jgi:hypothetical protein
MKSFDILFCLGNIKIDNKDELNNIIKFDVPTRFFCNRLYNYKHFSNRNSFMKENNIYNHSLNSFDYYKFVAFLTSNNFLRLVKCLCTPLPNVFKYR